jgi:hypothetical protein
LCFTASSSFYVTANHDTNARILSLFCFVLFYTILAISLREHSSRTKSGTPDLFTLLFKYHQGAFWIVHQARSPAFGKQYMRMACSVGAQKQGQDAEKQLEAFVQS